MLVKAAYGVEQNIMLFVEVSSTSPQVFSFYREDPRISSHTVVTDSDKHGIEVMSQRVSIVVLLQLSPHNFEKRIYHDQLSINRGNTANLLYPFRTRKKLKVTKERFMFLNLFFKSKGTLPFDRQCFISLHLSYAVMYFLRE